MRFQLAISPQLQIWFAIGFACLALGGAAVLVAQIRIRPYLPPEERPYASVRDVFVHHVFQPETPEGIRRAYLSGLAAMTLAPFIGLAGVFVEGRGDLVWPFVVLCAIGAFTAYVLLRGGLGGSGRIP